LLRGKIGISDLPTPIVGASLRSVAVDRVGKRSGVDRFDEKGTKLEALIADSVIVLARLLGAKHASG
jgi:hypothetical protein